MGPPVSWALRSPRGESAKAATTPTNPAKGGHVPDIYRGAVKVNKASWVPGWPPPQGVIATRTRVALKSGLTISPRRTGPGNPAKNRPRTMVVMLLPEPHVLRRKKAIRLGLRGYPPCEWSHLASLSSVGNPRIETCVVQSVRRWEFPKPRGGGLVIVTFPLAFNPADGAEDEALSL